MVHEFSQRDEYINTSPNAHATNAWGLLRYEDKFPGWLKRKDVLNHFRDMERKGLLAKVSFLKPNRHEATRWQVTEKGYVFTNLIFASPASACASNEIPDGDALTQSSTGTAPVSAPATQGGMGGDASENGDALVEKLTENFLSHQPYSSSPQMALAQEDQKTVN